MLHFEEKDWLITAFGGTAITALMGAVLGCWWIAAPAALVAVVLLGWLLLTWQGRASTLIVTLGPPGCGKTWDADKWVAEDPRRDHVSKDAMRVQLGVYGDRDSNSSEVEQRVWQRELLAVQLALAIGRSVIVADTCQEQAAMNQWEQTARRYGAHLVVWDYRDRPLALCIAQDGARAAAGGRLVGAAAIRRVAARCAQVRIPDGAKVRKIT
jgi:predicted kinase